MVLNSTKKISIASLSLKGGRKDNFYFCLIDYFPDQSRAFVSKFLQVSDEQGIDGNEAIKKWIEEFSPEYFVVDFPQTAPPCTTCQFVCPGMPLCPHEDVALVNEKIEKLLLEDQEEYEKSPKDYEYRRQKLSEFEFKPDSWKKESDHHLLSYSFKRRLKKGFLPYWNRTIDFYIWARYHDQLLEVFKNSYDSFGHTPLILINRFGYLKKRLPESIKILESSPMIILLELLRSKIVTTETLKDLSFLEESILAKEKILHSIEHKFNLFIYGQDQQTILKSQRAFDSLLLGIAGVKMIKNECYDLPE